MFVDMSQGVLDLAARGRPDRTTVRDGSAVWVRPVGAGDETALRGLVEDLSQAALRSRFCGEVDRCWAAAALATRSERGDLAIVAQAGDDQTIVAYAASYRISPEAAEVAFLVTDSWQGRGLGGHVLAVGRCGLQPGRNDASRRAAAEGGR
jgi:GNAT superfamily N-acetyltransferase